VPTRASDDNPLPFTLTLASAAGLAVRMVSLVSAASHADADSRRELRQTQVAAAEENLAVAARRLPDAPEMDSLVADGPTLEAALKKLTWGESDVLVVGSSRVAAPKRVFLGSTAARILAGTDAPVIVIPRGD
jgi:nucleotide-binding universal stress UspA family protein